MALKTYRERARQLFGISKPEIILPQSIHPAFHKVKQQLNLQNQINHFRCLIDWQKRVVIISVLFRWWCHSVMVRLLSSDLYADIKGLPENWSFFFPDFRVNVGLVEKKITKNTILIVGSAPSFPHGVIDPIEDLAKVYQKKFFSGEKKKIIWDDFPSIKDHPKIQRENLFTCR